MKKDTLYSSKKNIHHDGISILNVYISNARVFTVIKETLLKLKSHIESHTLIVGDFNSRLSPIDKSLKQNIEIIKIIEVINQID